MIRHIVETLEETHGIKWIMQRYGVSRQSVWKWKTGKSDPSASTLIEMLIDYQNAKGTKCLPN